MKILHVHEVDDPTSSGGATVMHRLHTGLRVAGIDSQILCSRSKFRPAHSAVIAKGGISARLERQLNRVTIRFGLNDIHCLSTFGITKMDVFHKADLLHLHCIHGGFFNYLALPRLTKSKTAVFTLHDTWPYTGHCSFNYDCERWKIGCGQCPYPENYPSIRRDGTALEWKLKKWTYEHSKIVVVTLSTFQTERVKQSILSHCQVHQIPNGIDTDIFKPLDRDECRRLLGIPGKKSVLMFAATTLKARNKGADLLLRAIQSLPKSIQERTVLLMIGEGGETIAQKLGIECVNLGYVYHDRLKVIAYSAADLFVQPSRAESLPLVVQESMACGTPIVAFPVGGTVDLVRPGLTGYLAKPEDPADLAQGILQLIEDESLRKSLGEQCRRISVDEFSLNLQVRRHIDLYRQLI